MSLATQIGLVVTRIATEFKTVRALTTGTSTSTSNAISFGNPKYADYGTSFPSRVTKNGVGLVTLHMAIKTVTGNVAGGDALFTLPAGFRPSAQSVFVAGLINATSGWGGYAICEVDSNGTVYCNYASLANGVDAFGSIAFQGA